jgi:predicted aldo/keto reductase-like oxidoreductase
MQYRTMPGSDERLSALGFGCMRLPTRVGGPASSLIDAARAKAQIIGAIERGVNYIDTAVPYHLGASESFLGEHILSDPGLREQVYIATKLPCMRIKASEAMEATFAKQLDKLRVEHIDYYLLHALDGPSWDRMVSLGVVEFMERIKAEGRVRRMGFSFHGRKDDFRRIVDAYDFDFAQVQYNILDERYQAGIEGIEHAHAKGVGIVVMEPLRGGSLVGKIPAPVQRIYDQAEIQRSPVDWALRWIWNNPMFSVVLSGMNVEAHIDENIRVACDALPGGMSEAELAMVERVRAAYRELLQVDCTGCAYCMPCPAGIDIPAAFKNLNNRHMFGWLEPTLFHAAYLGVQTHDGQAHWTSSCIDCGKCERACPQGIRIRETFRLVQQDLEGPLVKSIAWMGRKLLGGGKKGQGEG